MKEKSWAELLIVSICKVGIILLDKLNGVKQCLSANLRYACMLVKLTPGVNFINIFTYEFFIQKSFSMYM